MGKVTPPLLKLLDRAIPSDQTHQIHPALHTPVGGNALRGRSQGARPGCTPATPVRAASISCPLRSSAWGYQRKRISRASGHIWWYFGTCLRFLDVDPSMAPHDLGTCGASVSSVRASSRRSLRGTVGDAPTSPSPSPPTSVTTPNDENQDCENEAAGQRRRNRALKLRQTRNRNAARPPQGYMSADESEDEVRVRHEQDLAGRAELYVLTSPNICRYLVLCRRTERGRSLSRDRNLFFCAILLILRDFFLTGSRGRFGGPYA